MTKKILVVDDDVELLESITTALTNDGYTVITAKDGEEGLTMAKTQRPNLILLDIMMPKVNGHKMLTELRKSEHGSHIPVILLTNSDDVLNISQSVERGGDDYLIKSQTSLKEISRIVKQHLVGYS